MLDYEWGNPSAIMLSGDDEPDPEPAPPRHIMDHYTDEQQTPFNANNNNTHLLLHHHHHHHQQQQPNPNPAGFHHHFGNPQHQTQVNPLFDPRAYGGASSSYAPPQMLSLDPSSGGIFVVPKSEELPQPLDFTARLGLNLGGRTYFSSTEDEFVNRLYRRSRALESGSANTPKCQAEGCNADLSHAKHYHRRHKVCEYHSKAATVIAAGLTQRFCQQCSRFHLLSEFDNGKRSCRKRLADHNRRRRKSQQPNNQDNNQNKPHLENTRNTSSDGLARSPPDSGAQSSSSVTVAVSPPRISLDCFRQKPYQGATASSTSSNSVFFSTG